MNKAEHANTQGRQENETNGNGFLCSLICVNDPTSKVCAEIKEHKTWSQISPDVIYFQDGKTVTLFVPMEDSIFGYTELEQSVILDLKELEVKNPNTGTIDELMKRIMEAPPGQDIDRSLIAGDDPLASKLSGGTSLLSMPASMEVREFSLKDWLVDDAKEPDMEGGGGGKDDEAREKERLAKEEEDAKSFDCGQIMKARNEKEIELVALADKMQDEIAKANEKLGECSGAEAEELLASTPSLVHIKELCEAVQQGLSKACRWGPGV